MLYKVRPARERACLVGGWGGGKSFTWVTIARYIDEFGQPEKVYVLDTDHTALQQSEAFEGFENVVKWRDIYTWKDLIEGTEAALKVGRRDDWLVVDLADKPWSLAQDHFVDEAFGVEAEDFFLAWRRENKSGNALSSEWGSNWQVINKLYAGWMARVQRWPGHILFCTPAEAIKQPDAKGKGGDDKEVLEAFGRFGVRPGGQKHLGFQSMTVLYMQVKGQNQWLLTTMKDIHRTPQKGLVVGKLGSDGRPLPEPNFVTEYLVPVAGWTLDDTRYEGDLGPEEKQEEGEAVKEAG